jgi:hypothetical protein
VLRGSHGLAERDGLGQTFAAPAPAAIAAMAPDEVLAAGRFILDAHDTSCWGAKPPPNRQALKRKRHPGEQTRETKGPAAWSFSTCAEEDSNLRPVIPDQALNLAMRVSDASFSRRIVRCVRGSG